MQSPICLYTLECRDNIVCVNGGTLNHNTCRCDCPPPFTGPNCTGEFLVYMYTHARIYLASTTLMLMPKTSISTHTHMYARTHSQTYHCAHAHTRKQTAATISAIECRRGIHTDWIYTSYCLPQNSPQPSANIHRLQPLLFIPQVALVVDTYLGSLLSQHIHFIVSVITAWGVRWTGLPHGSKTDSDCLIKTIGAVTVRRPLKWQRERKKGGAAGDRTQGLWLEPPALCH